MMNSEPSSTSRRKRRAAPPPTGRSQGARAARVNQVPVSAPSVRNAGAGTGLQPVHLLILGTVGAATAGTLVAHGTRPANIVFVVLSILAVGIVAMAVYRTLWPLTSDVSAVQPEMVGGRTRAALEREKTIVLRAIKELEFDRAMGKVSESDCEEMIGRLRARAVRLIRQLDAGSAGYRDLIDRELNARLGTGGAGVRPVNGRGTDVAQSGIAARVRAAAPDGDASTAADTAVPRTDGAPAGDRGEDVPSLAGPAACLACGAINDADARFCKACGTKLGAPA